MDPCALLEPVTALAREAGAATLAHFGRADLAVATKADASPVTAADEAAHRVLEAGLARLTPDLPVLSEESAAGAVAARHDWSRFWLVDPLDGTKEFLAGRPEYTVNVALIEGGRPILGVVLVPASGRVYRAGRGGGAWRLDPGAAPRRISTRRPAPARLAVVASRSHAGPELAALLAALGDPELRSMGSALKFCLVAEGDADLYPRSQPTSEWDTGAAQCVVEEAGGRVTTLDGAPLAYNKESLVNPALFTVGDPGRDWSALRALLVR